MSRMRVYVSLLSIASALWVAAAPSAFGIACPNGGATLVVTVNNPTSSTPSVTVSGYQINGLATCTTGSSSYSQTKTLNSGTPTTYTFSGLDTGLWVHQVTVSGGYTQYQRGMVLETPSGSESSVTWSYFPNYVTVTTAGDGYTGTCGATCTFRQALATANNGTQDAAHPFLVLFSTSPGAMSNPNTLDLGKSGGGWVTIDGTNSAGSPWVVGDALAPADAFSYTIDLANTTYLKVTGSHNTMKGIAIDNTLPANTDASHTLIVSGTDEEDHTTIQAVRLDGGEASVHSGGTSCYAGCNYASGHLIALQGDGESVSTVEGRSAHRSAICATTLSAPALAVSDSWFHHNVDDQLCVEAASLTRNVVELGGYQSSDNSLVGSADGIHGTGQSLVTTNANVVRNNASDGIDVAALHESSPSLSLSNDYVCGNGGDGIAVSLSTNPIAYGTGLATSYNTGHGISFGGGTGTTSTLAFDNDSMFSRNGSAGMRNSSAFYVSAKNNQWPGVTGSPLPSCSASTDPPSGNVTCDPAQDYVNMSIALSNTHPVVPSNVIRAGQTIRISGTGFNAVDGNPPAPTPGCTPGPGADSQNCCRNADKANPCDTSSPPKGKQGQGNCVALRNGRPTPTWVPQKPISVTPATIALGLSASFVCIGQQSELARVSKLDRYGAEFSDYKPYCTTDAPK